MNKAIILPLLLGLPIMVAAQDLITTRDTVDLGYVIYNHPVTAEFELQNSGRSSLYINKVETSCGCATAYYPKRSIGRGRKFTISVSYDARQLGHFDKSVTIYSNSKHGPVTLWLKGIVRPGTDDFDGQYNYVIGNMKVDKTDIEFDDVNVGESPVQEIHIMNNGTERAEPQLMHLPAYLSATVTPKTIRPGHTAVARITLDSKKLMDFGLTQTSIFLGDKPGDKVSPDKEITVSAVLLPKFSENNTGKHPHAVVSTYNLNLKFEGKENAKGVILIQNHGNSQLDIRSVQLFTAGLQLKLNKTKIEPGKETKLTITAVSEQIAKVRTQPRVLLITNDPETPKIVITVNAK